MEALLLLATALVFGLRHAFDADHVVAVSTVSSQTKSVRNGLLVSACWGAGHTVTLCLCALFLIVFRFGMSSDLSFMFEMLVALMLVVLGVLGFRPLPQNDNDVTPDEHADAENGVARKQPYWRCFFIGLLHGLAGSAALSLMVASRVDNEWLGLLYIFIFGIGATLGMMVFSGILVIPLCIGRERTALLFRLLASTASVLVGLWLATQLCLGGL